MSPDLSRVTVSVTKPRGKPALMLAELGVTVSALDEYEGNVDRYIVGKRLAIERRTASAFLRGIMDKTLFTSAIYLSEHFAVPVLIVEGEVDYEHSHFQPQAVRGALSSMMLLYHVNVLSTQSAEETAHLIAMMACQEQLGIPDISLIPKRKAADLPDVQRRIVEMLPGCGMVLARDLLRHFGSIERIVAASPRELQAVRGLGTKKAAEIHAALHSEYESMDTEKDLEDAVEAAPELLFTRPVSLVARQHHIYTEASERHVVDMVFLDPEANELILVELKRGPLSQGHHDQLRRYLDHAVKSSLLRRHIEKGARPRGVLATAEPCEFAVPDPDVTVRVVDRQRVIAVLRQLRQRRLKRGAP